MQNPVNPPSLLHKLLGFSMIFGYPLLYAAIGPAVWPKFLAFKEHFGLSIIMFYGIVMTVFHSCVFLFCNLVMYIIYRWEHPFFE